MQASPAHADAVDLAQESLPPSALRAGRVDAILVVVLALATIAVHPWHLILSRPYWVDEAWVADLTRVPVSRLVGLTSSTPFGFAFLLRLVPGSGLQRARLVTLGFTVLGVATAYVFGRSAGWSTATRSRVAACIVALMVMLAPFSLERNDLKQYTGDAFCALVLLTLAMRADLGGDRAALRVWVLGAVAVGMLPFSEASAFVAVAAFAGLAGSALWERSRTRIVSTLAAGAATAIAFGAFFAIIVLPNTNAALRSFWNAYYLSAGPRTMWDETWSRLRGLHAPLGMPAIVFVALTLVGVVTLWRLRVRAVAIALPLLWIEMAVLARVRRYPFLDQRTSHFLLVSSIAVAGVGVAGMLVAIASRAQPVAIVVGVAAFALFATGFHGALRDIYLADENTRGQAMYIFDHRSPNDVILVNDAGSFGFSYYWPHGKVTITAAGNSEGFVARVAGLDAVWATDRTDAAVLAALREAVARWRAAPAGSRLFIARSHVNTQEALAWQRALATLGLAPHMIVTGFEPLLVLGPS